MTRVPEGFEKTHHWETLLSLVNILKDLKDINTVKDIENALSKKGKKGKEWYKKWIEIKVSYRT